MPLFEGIGLVGDKHPVILDIGTAYTRCGFAGETAPRAIISSEVSDWKTQKTTRVVDYNRPADVQFKVLVNFLHKIYYKCLLVNPKERRVLIVESVLCPTSFREILAKVLFKHYEVPSVLFAPCHLLACFTLGTQNALVIDIGYQETLVMPIFDGVPMLNCWEAAPVAAKAVHRSLEMLIKSECKLSTTVGQIDVSECPEILSEEILEDIKVRTCFVTTLERGRKYQNAKLDAKFKSELPKPAPDVEYPIDGDKILHLTGALRESAMEILFDGGVDDKSVAMLILDSLLRCPIDLRRPLAERICLIGGTCMSLGFVSRLKDELLDLLANHDRYRDKLPIKTIKFFNAPSKPNYTAWPGGAIFGALEILPHRSVTREAYEQNPTLPDWTKFQGTSEPISEEKPQQR